jgi:hypothetical protein
MAGAGGRLAGAGAGGAGGAGGATSGGGSVALPVVVIVGAGVGGAGEVWPGVTGCVAGDRDTEARGAATTGAGEAGAADDAPAAVGAAVGALTRGGAAGDVVGVRGAAGGCGALMTAGGWGAVAIRERAGCGAWTGGAGAPPLDRACSSPEGTGDPLPAVPDSGPAARVVGGAGSGAGVTVAVDPESADVVGPGTRPVPEPLEAVWPPRTWRLSASTRVCSSSIRELSRVIVVDRPSMRVPRAAT